MKLAAVLCSKDPGPQKCVGGLPITNEMPIEYRQQETSGVSRCELLLCLGCNAMHGIMKLAITQPRAPSPTRVHWPLYWNL